MIDSTATTYSPQRDEVAEEANAVIQSAAKCVDRGEGCGTCHVFLNHSSTCVCGKIDLEKARLK